MVQRQLISRPDLAMFVAFMVSILSLLFPQCVSATNLMMDPVGKSNYDGYKLLQRNKMLGMVEISVCPRGIRFCSPLINGILVDDKGLRITVFSDESKKYKQFLASAFKAKFEHMAGETGTNKIETKTICVQIYPINRYWD